MPDDRDRYRPKSPLARAASEGDLDEITPALSTDSQIGMRRVERTIARAGDNVNELRLELTSHIQHVDGKVDSLSSTVADLRQQTGEMSGKLDILVDHVKSQSHMKITAFQAEVEVEKARELSEISVAKTTKIATIEDERDRKAHRRRLALKIITVLASAWATVSTLALTNC